MANKRSEKNTSPSSASSRASKATKKNPVEKSPKTSFNYFRMSESYTSLILGVVVVVITSILLIAFLRNRTDMTTPQPTKDIATAITIGPVVSPTEAPIDVVSKAISQPVVPTLIPTVKPTIVITSTPVPTAKPTATPTTTVKKVIVTPTAKSEVKPTVVAMTKTNDDKKNVATGSTYTTKAGDDLWGIAEKYYQSGYNWVDIAKANNITDGNIIYAGMKLTIPSVAKKIATVTVTVAPTKAPTAMANLNKPQENHAKTYTIKPGDDLWDVAVAVYNDGYKWPQIAKANNLVNPNLIHSGNVLTIP